MSGIMIDKDATIEWLKGWGENTPHMDSARIIEAQDIKIAALEAKNLQLEVRIKAVVSESMVAEIHAAGGFEKMRDACKPFSELRTDVELRRRVAQLGTENATLRKRLIVDDAMIKRAEIAYGDEFHRTIRRESSSYRCMRAALEAASGRMTSMGDNIIARLRNFEWPKDLLDEAAYEIERLRARLPAARRNALREAEKIARNGCLAPPDGGAPTEGERIMCENIAAAIRALANKDDPK